MPKCSLRCYSTAHILLHGRRFATELKLPLFFYFLKPIVIVLIQGCQLIFCPNKILFHFTQPVCEGELIFQENNFNNLIHVLRSLLSKNVTCCIWCLHKSLTSSDYLGKRPDFGYFSLHPSLIWMRFSFIKCLQRMLSNHIPGDMWHMGSSLFLIVLQMW